MTDTGRLTAALADRYTIERELGAGGMATVYLAEDLKHHRKVAIKVLRADLAQTVGADRFLREIQLAAKLTHPHILPLFDSGEAGGALYYVMPNVEGESLRDRLEQTHQVPVAEAVRIATEVAGALDYAHRHGVVHRDIKPENIMLQDGHALVADFGIGKALSAIKGQTFTETGASVGTPAYMSPEQAAGDDVDGRSDLYSLGCVLYEMLVGEGPFTGRTAQAMIAKRFVQTPADVRGLREGVSRSLAGVVQKALARAPIDRFETGNMLVAALGAPDAPPPTAPAPAPPDKSIAVLPFANMSADPDNEYFADGITEDVIAQLSKIRAITVISRTSVMSLKPRNQNTREIGVRLGVATVLEGSVRRAGDRVRIVVQLIEANSERTLWAETYDRQLTDIFAIQTDVALRIVDSLRVELSPHEQARLHKEPTRNPHAYQLYLEGRHCLFRYTAEGVRKGIEYFEQAIAADPGYASAYAGLAFTYAEIGRGQGAGDVSPDEAYGKAKRAAAKALELDDDLGAAHCVLALLKFLCDYDWVGAEAEFKRALELDPGNADSYDYYGQMLLVLERYDEALVLTLRAQELDPLAHRTDLGTTLLRAGRHEEALRAAISAVEFDSNYSRAHANLGWIYLRMGRPEEGLAELEKAVELSPGETLFFAQLGQAYGEVGKIEKARGILRDLTELSQLRYVSPYHMAYVFTGLGEHDRAMDWLERAYEERSGAIHGIKGSFLFTSLRSHPRFTALLSRMHLV